MTSDLIFKLIDDIEVVESDLKDINYNELLGIIMINRISGIVYKKNKILSMFHREFLRCLDDKYESDKKTSKLYKQNLFYLSEIFKNLRFKHVFLKGSILSTILYDEGLRIYNDFDILINKADLKECQKLLKDNGFVQGYYLRQTKEIKVATRQDIIMSKLNYGQTVPFLKIENDLPICIDINFSLDYKANGQEDIVNSLLSNAIEVNIGDDIYIKGLSYVDCLIYLCCHLYKEATTYDWLQRERDLCLYKFYDIFLYIKKYLDKSFLNELCVRVKNLGLEKECLYTFINCKEIFKSLEQNYLMCNLIGKLMIEDLSFMKKIYWPEKKRTFMYDKSFKEWFSCNRKDNLILLEDYSNGKNQ